MIPLSYPVRSINEKFTYKFKALFSSRFRLELRRHELERGGPDTQEDLDPSRVRKIWNLSSTAEALFDAAAVAAAEADSVVQDGRHGAPMFTVLGPESFPGIRGVNFVWKYFVLLNSVLRKTSQFIRTKSVGKVYQ